MTNLNVVLARYHKAATRSQKSLVGDEWAESPARSRGTAAGWEFGTKPPRSEHFCMPETDSYNSACITCNFEHERS